ncbi:MAG: hypothetical protein JXD23_05875 [Spirochaetales bacterium]|nr:hypothetical protein [Spirochaetales bacterium]
MRDFTIKDYKGKITEYLKTHSSITTGEAAVIFRKADPDLPAKTVNWRLYELVNGGVLRRVGRGLYGLPDKPAFVPAVTPEMIELSSFIKTSFPLAKYCLWDTDTVRSLAHLLPRRIFMILEAEKDALEQVFDAAREKYDNVFFPKDYETAFNYSRFENTVIFVKPLPTEAPVKTVDGVPVPELEKILVDVYCDKDLFGFLAGGEWKRLFENARSRYSINVTRLVRYAARRGQKEYFKKFYESRKEKRKRSGEEA